MLAINLLKAEFLTFELQGFKERFFAIEVISTDSEAEKCRFALICNPLHECLCNWRKQHVFDHALL